MVSWVLLGRGLVAVDRGQYGLNKQKYMHLKCYCAVFYSNTMYAYIIKSTTSPIFVYNKKLDFSCTWVENPTLTIRRHI